MLFLSSYECEQFNESISLLMPWLTFLNLYICLASVQEQLFSFIMSCTTSAYICFDLAYLFCCSLINVLSSPTFTHCILLRFPICFYLSVIYLTICIMHPIATTIISASAISFPICLIVLISICFKIDTAQGVEPHAVSLVLCILSTTLVVSLSSFLSLYIFFSVYYWFPVRSCKIYKSPSRQALPIVCVACTLIPNLYTNKPTCQGAHVLLARTSSIDFLFIVVSS